MNKFDIHSVAFVVAVVVICAALHFTAKSFGL